MLANMCMAYWSSFDQLSQCRQLQGTWIVARLVSIDADSAAGGLAGGFSLARLLGAEPGGEPQTHEDNDLETLFYPR